MSSSSDDTAALIAESDASFVAVSCEISAAVLFIYDCIITLGEESKYFWKSQPTGAAALFYLNKSLAILFYVIVLVAQSNIIPLSDESCIVVVKATSISQQLIYLAPGAFSALRTFALSQSWLLSLLIFFLSIFPPLGVNLVPFWFGLTGTVNIDGLQNIGCTVTNAVTLELARSFTIASRTSLMSADCLVIIVTLWRLLNRRERYSNDTKNTLMHIILRDGTIYFAVLVVLNCLHLTFSLLSFEIVSLNHASNISQFTGSLTAILVSRFLLHLQSANRRALDLASSQPVTTSGTSSVVFNRVIGSIGASLSPDDFFGGDAADAAISPPTSDSESFERSDGRFSPHGSVEDRLTAVNAASSSQDTRAPIIEGPPLAAAVRE